MVYDGKGIPWMASLFNVLFIVKHFLSLICLFVLSQSLASVLFIYLRIVFLLLMLM